MTKKAIFTYGRFNPPTIGHKAMIQKLVRNARNMGADPFIVVTHTQNKKKNPLTAAEKVKILEKMFPGVPVLATSKQEPSPKYIIQKLRNKNYNKIAMMVGSDRLKSFNWVGVPIISGGVRDPNANNATGMSASKARKTAMTGNLKKFSKMVNVNNPKNLMDTIINRLS